MAGSPLAAPAWTAAVVDSRRWRSPELAPGRVPASRSLSLAPARCPLTSVPSNVGRARWFRRRSHRSAQRPLASCSSSGWCVGPSARSCWRSGTGGSLTRSPPRGGSPSRTAGRCCSGLYLHSPPSATADRLVRFEEAAVVAYIDANRVVPLNCADLRVRGAMPGLRVPVRAAHRAPPWALALGAVKPIFNTAIKDRQNPCRIGDYDRYHTPERPTATIAQVFALADAMPAHFSALVVAALSGLRLAAQTRRTERPGGVRAAEIRCRRLGRRAAGRCCRNNQAAPGRVR